MDETTAGEPAGAVITGSTRGMEQATAASVAATTTGTSSGTGAVFGRSAATASRSAGNELRVCFHCLHMRIADRYLTTYYNRSNNPFAFATQSQSPPLASTSSAATTSSFDAFSLPSTFANSQISTPATSVAASNHSASPAPAPAMRPARSDGEHAHLANLLANREDGLDTFGNVGTLR